MSWWDRKRAERDAKATSAITGIDPRKSSAGVDEQGVKMAIAKGLRQLYDGGVDPVVLVQSYLAGAVWLADNSGITRDELKKAIDMLEMKRERQLIFKPGD